MEQSAELAEGEVAAVSVDGPLPPEDMAAYLDGRLSGEELERVESALAGSAEARAELVEASRLIAMIPERQAQPKRQWVLVSAVAAAAVLAVVMVPPLFQKPAIEQVATERRAAADAGAGIRTVAPEDGAVVGSVGVRFAWDAIPAATYQLTVTDAQGRTVWQAATTDTTLVLPGTTKLRGPASYYWNVDALAPDGSSMTTGVREFKILTR